MTAPAPVLEHLSVYDRWVRARTLREEGYTVQEIGRRLDITHQRVCQLLASEEPQKPARPPARGPYPWDTWFWAGSWTAVKGKDFTCDTGHFCQQARNMASRLGVGVKVRILDPEGRRVRFVVVPKRAIGRATAATGGGRRPDAGAPPGVP